MRRTALLLLILPLAACSSGGSADGTAASAATTTGTSIAATSSATASTSASLEAGVQRDCLKAGLDYVPLKTALTGSDDDLISALQYAEATDLDAAGETEEGKAADLALAELGYQVALGHAQATTDNVPNRAELQRTYTAAAAACEPFGAAF